MPDFLNNDFFVLFVIILLGVLAGRIKVKGIALDLSAVIFVALVFGHYGYSVPKVVQTIGLLLFIYSVGIQAGPGFFESFRSKGLKLIIIALILVVSGALTSLLAIYLFSIDNAIAVGLFAGALTSTPGLAAAIESSGSNLSSIGYGIAYPFGVIGVILFVHLIPRILKVNISKATTDYQNEARAEHPDIIFKHFIVKNANIFGKSIGELKIRTMTQANISRIRQKGETVIPDAQTSLHKGDLIRAVGSVEALEKVKLLIGPETEEVIQLKRRSEIQWILVTNRSVVNKTLGQLNLFSNYGATVTRIRRSGIDITPNSHSQIRFGDKLLVACSGTINEVSRLLGNEEKRLRESDLLPIVGGLVLGMLLGNINWPLPGGLDFKLGLTGGVLITALILSRIGKTGPIIWNVSGPANQFMRQIGLVFFLAAVGTDAGSNLLQTINSYGIRLLIIGFGITLLPMIIATSVGHYLLKINFLTLLGSLTGGMTSTPGLSATDALSDSNAPGIAYATVYPVAMVCLILCTQLLCLL